MANSSDGLTESHSSKRARTTPKKAVHSNPYEHLVGHFPDILYRYNVGSPAGFEFINPAVAALTGSPPSEYLQNPVLIFEKVFSDDRHILEDILTGQNIASPVVIRWNGHGHDPVWTEHRAIPVIAADGSILAIEGIIRDIPVKGGADETDPKSSVVPHLIALGKAVEKPASLYEMAEIIGVAVKHLCHADAGILIKLSTPHNQVLCLWADGIEDNRIKTTAQQVYLALKDRPANRGELLVIKDPQDDTGKFHSMILCPLTYEKNLRGGLACFHAEPRPWGRQELDAIEAFARQAAIALENIQLTRELQDTYLQAILALTKTMKVRDVYTADHSHQLVGWAESLAWKLGCRSRDIESIRWAALLHDIGKIGIPDMVLGKPSRLNADEWMVMKRHPQIGAEIVGVIQQMKTVSPLIKYHHEHFDGSGYPDGLNGDQIPLGARILAVVDAYSAMISDRVYRPARPPKDARDELARTAGTQFDPQVVTTFLQMLNFGQDQIRGNQLVN